MTTGSPPRAVHRDRSGTPVLSYVAGSDDDRPAAFGVLGIGDVDLTAPDLVDLLIADLPGWVLSGPSELGLALEARGARVRRRFHVMTRSLAGDPPPPEWAETDLGPGHRAVRCDRDPHDILDAYRAAYSTPGHPDPLPDRDDEVLAERLAPLLTARPSHLLPSSRLVVDPEDRVVAGAFLQATPRGPWIADVFRRPGPDQAGLGSALLRQVLAGAAADGVRELGLAVTDGNPAQGRYARLGFRTTLSLTTLVMPEATA